MTRKTTKTGKELERRVADAYRAMGARRVEHDVELAGRQIDVYVELGTSDRSLHRIAVEAKDYASPVGVKIVSDFSDIVDRLRRERLIDEGVIVSASGFSRPARNAAEEHDIRLLEPSDLETMVAEAKAALQPQPTYTPPPLPGPDTLPDPGPLPPGSHLPFHRNALFTGRATPLKTLARTLLPQSPISNLQSPTPNLQSPTLITQAIQGLGGVGKTQLAVEFAHRYGRFFHGVHWLNGAQPDAIGAEVAGCGAALSLPNWPEKQPAQVARTLDEWRRGGPRLVILDNLEQVSAAREWLARLSGGGVRLLLTARRSDWPADLGLTPLRLDVFTPDESREFLGRYIQTSEVWETSEVLDALAERLGHLPLALELAGRYLARHRRLSVAAYLEKLERVLTHPSMEGWRAELGNPTGHDLDLAATFALSWERVTEGSARRLFRLAGYCAPNQPIPHGLLQRALQTEVSAGFWKRLVRLFKKRPQMDYDRALDRLTGLGLLQMEDPDAGPTIHPLLAEYARSPSPRGGGPGIGAPLPALADALATLAREAGETSLPARFTPLRPHMEAVAEAAEREGLEDAGILWNNLGYHLGMVADYAGARAAFERSLVIGKRVYGPEHPKVAIRVNNLGGMLRALGDLGGARAAYERALAIDERVYGPDHPNVARDVNNLGLVLGDLGDLAGARAAYERALAIDERVYGPDHPEVATDVNNLGLVLQHLEDLAGARAAHERALAIWQAAYGEEHPQVATAHNNLGRVLQDLGDLAGARAAIERALAIDERVYGPDHPDVARNVNNLGSVLQGLGDLAGAQAAYERALTIWQAAYGEEHPQVATAHNNLGLVLKDLGDLAGARVAYERALAIWRAAYGEEHPRVATAHNNLGSVLRALGDLVGARAAYERALCIWEAALPPGHRYIEIARGNLESVK